MVPSRAWGKGGPEISNKELYKTAAKKPPRSKTTQGNIEPARAMSPTPEKALRARKKRAQRRFARPADRTSGTVSQLRQRT